MAEDVNILLERSLKQIGDKEFTSSDVINYIMSKLRRKLELEEIAELAQLIDVQVENENKLRFFI